MIAQELKNVFPEVVKDDGYGFLTVEYSSVVAPLVEAIEELKGLFDDLLEQVIELAGNLTALAMSEKSQDERIAEVEAQNRALRADLEAVNDNFRRELDELKANMGD